MRAAFLAASSSGVGPARIFLVFLRKESFFGEGVFLEDEEEDCFASLIVSVVEVVE